MSLPPAPAPFSDADYEMIADAVLETARGRWFLSEHARRNRQADTRLVLQAIERLEHALSRRGGSNAASERFGLDLVDMMNVIMRTKNEIASIKPARDGGQIDDASHELDAIVETTEKATSDILGATERIQDAAWKMREQGVDDAVCGVIESNAAEVYTACSFQDLTGQRIRKVIQVLRFLEARIDSMIKLWRLDELESAPEAEPSHDVVMVSGPARPGEGLQQEDIDELLATERDQDIVWSDNRPAHRAETPAGDRYDLDDLQVFEHAAEQPEIDAPHAPAGGGTEKKAASAVERGIGSLSLTERIALFS